MEDTFGFRLRFYRTRLGLTQQQLADKSGVSRKQISDFEKEIQKNPRPQTLFKLADALGISFTDLSSGLNRNLSDSELLNQNRSEEVTIDLPIDAIELFAKRAEQNGTSIETEIYLTVIHQLDADMRKHKDEHREGLDSEILEKLNKLERDLQNLLKQKNNKAP